MGSTPTSCTDSSDDAGFAIEKNQVADSADSEIYDSIYETPRMALVAALTDAVKELLAEGDVTAARVALKALDEVATLAPPNGNVTQLEERRKRERSGSD